MDYISEMRQAVGQRRLLIPSVSAIVQDDAGRVLLCRQFERTTWGLVGGAIEPGETPAEAVCREAVEECGLVVAPVRIVGVYGGEDFFVSYPNGDEVAYVSTVFSCEVVGGELRPDGVEVEALRYFAQNEIGPEMNLIARTVLPDVFAGNPDSTFQSL